MMENSVKLGILTPSYNRADLLPKLYESLLQQTDKNFIWMVVDDGSSDGTAELVESWKRQGKIRICYLYQENGGKHTALNLGISRMEAGLTFIVDSDDWLPDNAVEIILKEHDRYRGKKGLCGYSFLRFYPDGTVNDAFFPEDRKEDTYVNVRINGGIAGDKAEVFYTDILKEFPFPIYKEEKFLPEDLIWMRMSGPYRMIHINSCIYISEYLEGGLTKTGRRMKLKAPRGMVERSLVYLRDSSVNLKTKLKMAMLCQIYSPLCAEKVCYDGLGIKERVLLLFCKAPGWIILQRWKKIYVSTPKDR